MSQISLGVWNVEWLNDLFTSVNGQAAFKPDGTQVRGPRSGNTVRQRRDSLAGVLNALAFDAVVVVEGPNTTEELQLFFDAPEIGGTWRCVVQRSPRMSQCVGIAVRTDTGTFANPPLVQFDALAAASGAINKASDAFDFDSDDDGIDERHKFERRPLYVELRLADGARCRVVGLHLKSKGIFSAYEWSKWWALAGANRMKLLAQCRHFRQLFLDSYLGDPATRDVPLLVCGDINDGPGFDTSEMRLKASAVETLMGSVWQPELCLGNALFDALSVKDQQALDFEDLATTCFSDPIFNDTFHNVWIDHILYSRNGHGTWVKDGKVHAKVGNQAIWRAFPFASDHYPISATVAP
jgi:endonuclease/exonuclease/phosphatase family metal-dependent hydrolase